MKLCFSSQNTFTVDISLVINVFILGLSYRQIQLPSILAAKSYEAQLCCLVFGTALSLKTPMKQSKYLSRHGP